MTLVAIGKFKTYSNPYVLVPLLTRPLQCYQLLRRVTIHKIINNYQ